MAADGQANTAIARALSVSAASVSGWRARFAEEGLVKFAQVREGRGRKKSIPQDKIDQIVDLTLNYRPEGETHWSCRSMAAASGVSKSTVQQVWSARGLKPHRIETFKLSNDPNFEAKLVDVVGLYLKPPQKAIVLCADEKSSVQALDRTQASWRASRFPDCGPNRVRSGKGERNWLGNTRNTSLNFVTRLRSSWLSRIVRLRRWPVNTGSMGLPWAAG